MCQNLVTLIPFLHRTDTHTKVVNLCKYLEQMQVHIHASLMHAVNSLNGLWIDPPKLINKIDRFGDIFFKYDFQMKAACCVASI